MDIHAAGCLRAGVLPAVFLAPCGSDARGDAAVLLQVEAPAQQQTPEGFPAAHHLKALLSPSTQGEIPFQQYFAMELQWPITLKLTGLLAGIGYGPCQLLCVCSGIS